MLGLYLSAFDTNEEKSKFKELYEKYRFNMYKAAMSVLQNKYDAEDAVHEAFMKLTDRLSDVNEMDGNETRAFLMIISRNIARDILRKKKKVDLIEDFSDFEDNASVEDNVFSRIDADIIRSGAQSLPVEIYDTLLLEQMGYDIKAIADLLNITYDCAWKRISRAKSKLKSLTQKELVTNEY